MQFRLSILDLTAAIIVLVAILLPERSVTVSEAFAAGEDEERAIALYQARLALDPGDAEAAGMLSELLADVGQTDWAVQVAGESARHSETMSWRALLAVSAAHAERIEVHEAHRFAQAALEQCRKLGPELCPGHEEVRMAMYFGQLDAGVKSGIDPRHDPKGYQRAVLSRMRFVQVRGATPDTDDADEGGDTGETGGGKDHGEDTDSTDNGRHDDR